MPDFRLPDDLAFNNGLIADPDAYVREHGVASWLFLVGDEFAKMPGGISWAQVQAAAPHSARVPSDPPLVLDLDLARQHVAALDELPRPTLISCRTGPRASAVTYLYAALREGAAIDDVLAAAERDGAPFVANPDHVAWLRASLSALREEERANG